MCLAGLGAQIIAVARNEDKLKDLVQKLPGSGHRFLVLDLSDLGTVQTQVKKELELISGGAIEILLNNSGGPKGGPILDAKPEEFSHTFQQHVLSAQMLAQLLVPGMQAKNYGRIINVISTSVKAPIIGLGVSNTIRAAMASWAKTLSLEVASLGITVNSVLPGYTKTERLSGLLKAAAQKTGRSENDISAEWQNLIPARRFAEASEIAAVVGFLASPQAGYVNGVSIPVDGGRTLSI